MDDFRFYMPRRLVIRNRSGRLLRNRGGRFKKIFGTPAVFLNTTRRTSDEAMPVRIRGRWMSYLRFSTLAYSGHAFLGQHGCHAWALRRDPSRLFNGQLLPF